MEYARTEICSSSADMYQVNYAPVRPLHVSVVALHKFNTTSHMQLPGNKPLAVLFLACLRLLHQGCSWPNKCWVLPACRQSCRQSLLPALLCEPAITWLPCPTLNLPLLDFLTLPKKKQHVWPGCTQQAAASQVPLTDGRLHKLCPLYVT